MSRENQDFIRNNYETHTENWVRENLPSPITYKKAMLCIKNLRENPNMDEVTDFI